MDGKLHVPDHGWLGYITEPIMIRLIHGLLAGHFAVAGERKVQIAVRGDLYSQN